MKGRLTAPLEPRPERAPEPPIAETLAARAAEPAASIQQQIGNRAFARLARRESTVARQPTKHAPAKAERAPEPPIAETLAARAAEPAASIQQQIGNRAFARLARRESTVARQPTKHAPAKAAPTIESWESHIDKGGEAPNRPRTGNPPILFVGDGLVVRARFAALTKDDHPGIAAIVRGSSALIGQGWEDDRTYRWTFRFDHAGSQRIGFQLTSGGTTIDTYDEQFRVVGRSISAQDIETIVTGHLRFWHQQMHNGLAAADLKEGDEDSRKWFYASLAGNLLWAATAFIDPAAYAEAKVGYW